MRTTIVEELQNILDELNTDSGEIQKKQIYCREPMCRVCSDLQYIWKYIENPQFYCSTHYTEEKNIAYLSNLSIYSEKKRMLVKEVRMIMNLLSFRNYTEISAKQTAVKDF